MRPEFGGLRYRTQQQPNFGDIFLSCAYLPTDSCPEIDKFGK